MQIGHYIVGGLVLVIVVLAVRVLARLGYPLKARRSRARWGPPEPDSPFAPFRERAGETNYDPLSMYDR